MSQRFILPGGWYPTPEDSDKLTSTVQLLLSKGSFIIEGVIWHVIDYSAEYNKFVPRYRVKLRADRLSAAPGRLYNPYEKPSEVTLDIETVAQAECGECEAHVFFVNVRGGFFNREIIMRDAKCCLSREIEGYKQPPSLNEQAWKDIFDALYKKNVGNMAKTGDFGSFDGTKKSAWSGWSQPVEQKIPQDVIDDLLKDPYTPGKAGVKTPVILEPGDLLSRNYEPSKKKY